MMKITSLTLALGSTTLIAFLAAKDFLVKPRVLIQSDESRQEQHEASREELERKKMEELREALAGLNADIVTEQSAETQVYQQKIREICDRMRARLPRLSRNAASPMQGFGNALYLVRLGAEDIIMGTKKRDEYVSKAMNALINELAITQAELLATVEAFEASTRSRINRHQAATLELVEAHQAPLAAFDLPDFSKMERELSSLFANFRNITIGTAIEAAMIRPTISVISRALGHVTARAVTTATAAGVAAVSDGPLPIGDAIGATLAVGGGAWIAWDVRKAAKQMEALPRNMQRDMNAQINTWQRESLKTIDQINKLSIENYKRVLP